MDLSTRNAEVNLSRIRSCRHILQTAGIPYVETTNLTEALTYPVVMFSPIVFSTTFTSAERLQIQQYVNSGGVLIASSVRDPALYPLFGVSGYTNYTDLKSMTWEVDQAPQYFDRFDDGFEKVIALSDTTGPQTVDTFILRPYATTGNAQVLAHFSNNTNALIMNQTGAGRTFLFAVDLRDVIIRNLINSDLHAQRAYSNIFEPTTDTFIFFVMNVVREHIPNLVRSHPCPNCDGSVVMITHDVDSRTAMDTMQVFVNYEEANHLNGMYNITTRYFHDSWMTAFYVDSYDKVEYVRQHGQRLASHSVGHFPDYDNETLFPFTGLGNTPVNYQPRYFNSVTTGGNVYGEVEVSKYLLENDHQVAIKSFRAGHLAYNQRLPKALQDCGYLYNSTFSANDVLTNFPFWDIDNMTFSGSQTSVLEIPMTISDASASNPFTEQNAMSVAQEWVSVTQKNYNNNAPTVLLIHPNRGYKLPAEQYFVNNLPSDVKYMFLDDFGDYWKKRLNMQYETVISNDTLKVTWTNYQMNQGLSFVIDDVSGLNAIRFFDGVGNELYPQSVSVDFGETRFCQFVYDESFEVCNGLDDDGDGNIDENLGYTQYQDNDNDEYGNPNQSSVSCFALVGYVTNNLDCDDNNTVVHPNNSEYCDHIDNNCDGQVDEGLTWNNYYADNDVDGFGNTLVMVEACIAPDNFVLQPGDCNDDVASINSNASEVCNDLDDNCDTNVDEGLQFVTYYEDLDQDGYGNDAVSVVKCVLPFGFVTLHGDCTDNAPAINPSAAELCGDGLDNNCDGQVDEGCIIDNDEDGYDSTVDCDDENALIYPNAVELCNNIDDDCDGTADNGLTFVNYYVDTDGDGYGAGAASNLCSNPGAGYVTNNTDCNNNNATIHAITTEVCNNFDDDCNGVIDNGLTFVNYYVDTDGDGYGAGTASNLCSNPGAGYVTNNTDCNNNNATVHAITTEVCNNFDDDCNGVIDNGLTFVNYYVDTDGDGYGFGTAVSLCANPGFGFVTNNMDCNGSNSAINPGAVEICGNAVDEDCSGTAAVCVVLGCTNSLACNYNPLATQDNGSCVLPAIEICNNLDDDCNGVIDNGLTFVNYYVDTDGDGYGAGAASNLCSNPGAGYVTNNTDCNNNNATVHAITTEVCNNLDDDCNGVIDNGLTFVNYYVDTDGDGYGAGAASNLCSNPGAGYVTNNTDCSASNNAVHPGAIEVCGNQLDDDCTGGDAVCAVLGCTNSAACNFNPLATQDNGSCILPSTEICNGIDDDCDGQTDENLTSTSITAIAANSAPYPTCTTGNFFSANFNNAQPSGALLENQGVVIWYKLTAVTNAMRIGLSAAYGDNAIRLYRNNGGCMQFIVEEHETSTGNQILLSDQLVVGGEYYIAVQHLSGAINTSAKICINHFVGSTCDHVYSNGTGIYSSVCSPFKAQYRGSASQYIFNVLGPIAPWQYTTPSSSSIVSRLGTIVPANLTTTDINYNLRIDVIYSISDIAGNYTSLTAVASDNCSLTLNPESAVSLRTTDRCPAVKTLIQSISVDRSICGVQRYEWKFTRTLPTAASPITVLGGLNSAVLFLNTVPGLSNNATYNVQVRPVHASGSLGEWGSVQCMKTGSTSGMVLESNGQGVRDEVSSNQWMLYPNPSLDGNIQLIALHEVEDGLRDIEVMDAMGRRIWKTTMSAGGNVSLTLPTLAHGMYFVCIDGVRLRCVIGNQ
jgi:hypothetical protein